ncbi:MAG: GNAT family N-acetyltransferase [Oscillospiraceae bacterium]|nr:GNAT family N-acetyltransferase [Oscillospiraceae bacterium]
MLIRWAGEKDLQAWYALATEVSPVFEHLADMGADPQFMAFAESAVGKYEALTAIDYMSGLNMGFIGFSRQNNSILWFAVSEKYRGKGAGNRLLKTALRQLDTNKDITVTTFREDYPSGKAARVLYENFGFVESKLLMYDGLPRCEMTRQASPEKRGNSFHYRYPEFIRESQKEHCPVCNAERALGGQHDIEVNDKVWIVAEYPGQGRLFGKMYVMPVNHAFHFEDMPKAEAEAFMSEVRRAGRALRKVTGAVKINYEMHSNSGAHLHIHLFPRYPDDDYPGMSIDVLQKDTPYESFEEFLWFVERMREELCADAI